MIIYVNDMYRSVRYKYNLQVDLKFTRNIEYNCISISRTIADTHYTHNQTQIELQPWPFIA